MERGLLWSPCTCREWMPITEIWDSLITETTMTFGRKIFVTLLSVIKSIYYIPFHSSHYTSIHLWFLFSSISSHFYMKIIISSQTHRFHPFSRFSLIWLPGLGSGNVKARKGAAEGSWKSKWEGHLLRSLRSAFFSLSKIQPTVTRANKPRREWMRPWEGRLGCTWSTSHPNKLRKLAICSSPPKRPRGLLKHRLIMNCKCNSNFLSCLTVTKFTLWNLLRLCKEKPTPQQCMTLWLGQLHRSFKQYAFLFDVVEAHPDIHLEENTHNLSSWINTEQGQVNTGVVSFALVCVILNKSLYLGKIEYHHTVHLNVMKDSGLLELIFKKQYYTETVIKGLSCPRTSISFSQALICIQVRWKCC